jgi:hypothetical protein
MAHPVVQFKKTSEKFSNAGGGIMIKHIAIGAAFLAVVAVPAGSWGEENVVVSPQERVVNPKATMPEFPPSPNCTTNRPCRNVVGEVVRIEESYWIREPNGNELHFKTDKETKLDALPKVGDNIAAQITSSGDAKAVKTLEEKPKTELPLPEKTLKDVR